MSNLKSVRKPASARIAVVGQRAFVPLISVLVPVYNEAATVTLLVERVLSAADIPLQVIVVDDGSTDGTSLVLRGARWLKDVEVLRHLRNRGKGVAIRTGLPLARGRFVIIQDADLEYCPEDYAALLGPLLADKAEVVYGSRYLARRCPRAEWRCFRVGVEVLNLCVRLLYGVRLTDEATCYKVFRTEVLRAMDLECERFEFCPEVTAKASRMGLRIVEVPIRYTRRSRKEGKKIRWRDGLVALWTLWRWRRWRPRVDVRARHVGRGSERCSGSSQTTGKPAASVLGSRGIPASARKLTTPT